MSRLLTPVQKIKTPSVKTLGVLLFGLSAFSQMALAADCIPSGAGEMAVVDRIYDGDTVKLTDGRHIRVLGFNAPEIDHGKDRPAQALGDEARVAAEAFFSHSKTVRLYYDQQRVDRYERTLAHIYDAQGNSLSAYLLRKGLGFHIAIPPNLSLNACLHEQEMIARRQALGVWSNPGWRAKPASQLTDSDTGFQRISGKVVAVHEGSTLWLELDGPLAIKITANDKANFPGVDWLSWKGKKVEVRGWVTDSGGHKKSARAAARPLQVQPRIAGALELLP